MRPSAPARRVLHRPAAGENVERVDSRSWYWVAAIPATFAFWVVAVAWVAIAIGLGPIDRPNPVAQSAEISLIVFGVPFLALSAVFPFAVYADASAIRETDVDWRPSKGAFTGGAAIGPLLAAAALMIGLVTGGGLTVPLWAVVLGFLLAVPVASLYVFRRHDRLGVP